MVAKVTEQNEVSLNGVFYPLAKPVQSMLASIYPSKIVIGDTTKDSQLRSSIMSWSDWRGGIGVERIQDASDVDRAWYSTCQLRYRHHLVLGPLSTVTTNQDPDDTVITGDINMIAELGSTLYATYGQAPYYYGGGTIDGLGLQAVAVLTVFLLLLLIPLQYEWAVPIM